MPPILGLSIEENLDPKLAWLKARLELDDEGVSKLVKRLPAVFNYSIEQNIEPRLAWLGERLLLDDKTLSLVIQRMPSLLGYNIETNLEPTIKFYEECVGPDATRRMIATSPALLGSSIEKRLKPRLAECQEAGIPIDTGTVQRMAKNTEDQWSISVEFQKDKRIDTR